MDLYLLPVSLRRISAGDARHNHVSPPLLLSTSQRTSTNAPTWCAGLQAFVWTPAWIAFPSRTSFHCHRPRAGLGDCACGRAHIFAVSLSRYVPRRAYHSIECPSSTRRSEALCGVSNIPNCLLEYDNNHEPISDPPQLQPDIIPLTNSTKMRSVFAALSDAGKYPYTSGTGKFVVTSLGTWGR